MTENQKKTIESYNNSVQGFAEKIAMLDNYDESYEFFASLVKDNQELLDLACGPAQISRFVMNKAGDGIKVTGVDLSSEMLQHARLVIPGGNFIEGSIIDFRPSDGKKFDACALGFGLPYLSSEEAEKCIENISMNLKSDGVLYLSFMNNEKNSDNEFVQLEKTSFGGENIFEIHYHKKEVIETYLLRSGFEIIKCYCLDYEENDGSISKDEVMICRKK